MTQDDRSPGIIRPLSKRLVTVPPILFLVRHLSPRQRRRPFLVWRVLPAIAVAAAMRASAVVRTYGRGNRARTPTVWPAPRTLLPISQRSRLAAGIAADAGALLPHPFTLCREA